MYAYGELVPRRQIEQSQSRTVPELNFPVLNPLSAVRAPPDRWSSKIITSGTNWRTTWKSNLRNFAIVRSRTLNEGVPYYWYALFSHEVKENLAGAKENQTESSARAPQQERKKKTTKKQLLRQVNDGSYWSISYSETSTNLAAILKTASLQCYNHRAVIIAGWSEAPSQS